RALAPSKEALDTPLSPPPLNDEPGPATGLSGDYPDGTSTRRPGPASRTHHARTLRPRREPGDPSRSLVVADDHAAASAPGQVPPGEVDQRRDPVPAAEQGDQVQPQPAKPGERTPGPDPDGELGDR